MANLSSYFGDAVASGQSNNLTDPRELPVAVMSQPYVKSWVNQWDSATEQVFWYTSIPTYLHMYNTEWSSVYTDYAWGNPNPTNWTTNYYKATNNASIMGGYLIHDPANTGTYETVMDHSGYSGYLNWVIGLGHQGGVPGALTYIKITVDGQAYEFKGTLHFRNDQSTVGYERMVWGCWQDGTIAASSPYSGGMFGGSYTDYGTGRHNRYTFLSYNPDSMVPNMTENYPTMINPIHCKPVRGIQPLKFSNSIKVEVKNELDPTDTSGQSTTYFSNYACCSVTRDLTLPGY